MGPPGSGHRGIESQPGLLDVDFDTIALLEGFLQQRFGKGVDVLQATECLVQGIQVAPVTLDGLLQVLVRGRRGGLVPLRDAQWDVF